MEEKSPPYIVQYCDVGMAKFIALLEPGEKMP